MKVLSEAVSLTGTLFTEAQQLIATDSVSLLRLLMSSNIIDISNLFSIYYHQVEVVVVVVVVVVVLVVNVVVVINMA